MNQLRNNTLKASKSRQSTANLYNSGVANPNYGFGSMNTPKNFILFDW